MMTNEGLGLDIAAIKDSFERSAGSYDAVAVLQREVGARLVERLDLFLAQPRVILDVGAGTGWCSAALAQRYRKARIIAFDLAQGMLLRARGRFSPWSRRLRGHGFVCGDAQRLPFADASFDMLFSNLTLQWCASLETVFAEFRRVLKPGGLLLFTTLGPDTLRELRSAWANVDQGVHVNSFLDMHDVGDALVRASLADPVMDMEHITMTYGDVNGLMRDLKGLGAHNVHQHRARGLTGRGRIKALAEAYEKFRHGGVLPATYEVLYGHAWAPEGGKLRPAPGGEVRVPLERIGKWK